MDVLAQGDTAQWRASRYILPNEYYPGDQIKKNEMGGVCGTYGGPEKFMQGFGGET
jgi:hypothetical protein